MKWVVTYKMYPEPMFPRYCQGAGFGLSRTLLDCAAGGHHVSDFRYIPFEDVSIGILAERCGYEPIMTKGVKAFRADTEKERKCVRKNIPMTECYGDSEKWPPTPHMEGNLIQHRVETREDMDNMHKSLDLEPRDVKPIPEEFDTSKQVLLDIITRDEMKAVVWKPDGPWDAPPPGLYKDN